MHQQAIEHETKRLSKIFSCLPDNQFNLVISLIRQVAFMTVELEFLSTKIVTTKTTTGIDGRKNPDIDIYNAMIKNHLRAVKQLCDLLPKDKKDEVSEELINFLRT
jgi:hypothetical protein